MIEEAFEVRGEDGLVRRGILTRPETGGEVAVLLLPAGLKYRIGPHRMNVKLARGLAARGYTVLRYDPAGLGESDGTLPAGPNADLWNQFEEGRFAGDVLLAARALRERHGARRVVAGGLCGGAIIAQHAAARSPQALDGVLSIGTPVTLASRTGSPARPASAGIAKHHFQGYLRKLWSRDAWSRLLRGESDFGAIRATLGSLLRGSPRPGARGAAFPNENPSFIASFRRLEERALPHLLIFGGGDNRWLEFDEMILQRYLKGVRRGKGYETTVIPLANHELHLAEWQEQAAGAITGWLEARFPARGAT